MIQSEQSSWNKKVQPLLTRIKELGEPITRTEQINRLVTRFVDKDPSLDFKINQSIYHFRQSSGEDVVNQEAKKELQNILVSYLFYQNRFLYQQEGGIKYDFAKEKRQVDAVVSALEGEHVHMGTGEGKSSTVIPICAIVEAITSPDKKAVVSTISETLLSDIEKKTLAFTTILKNLPALENIIPDIIPQQKKEREEIVDRKLQQTMIKEALLDNQFSLQTHQKITKDYWSRVLDEKLEEQSFLKPADRSKVFFLPERDLVFQASADPDTFVKNTPRVFMDEADIGFNRKSPYVRVRSQHFNTPEEIQNSTYQWLINYMVSQQVSEKDFEFFLGSHKLKEAIVDGLNFRSNPRQNPYFANGLNLISKRLGLNSAEAIDFEKKTIKYLNKNRPKKTDLTMYVQAVGDILAEVNFMKNRQYTINEETGLPVVRDNYTDELLERHEHQPEYQLAIHSLNNQFELVPLNKTSYSSVKFPTFTYWMSDKLVCFSGTLLYPHPKTQKIEKSSFAKFLEDITKKKVSLISPPELKTIPPPEWFDNNQLAEQSFIERLNNNTKPTLIIDYEGVVHTQKLYQALKEAYPEKAEKIIFLPPKPSQPDKEKEYNQYLKKITGQLAEEEIDMIVSSGTAGIGVNIVCKDGGFPDLKVVLFGMPENEAQLTQGVGRRRAEGDDFIWYLSDKSIAPYISYFSEEKADKVKIFLGEIDRLKIEEMIKEAKISPEKRLDVILELLKEKRRHETENVLISIEYDLTYQEIVKRFNEGMEDLLDSNGKPKNLVKKIGLPESLYFDIQRLHPIVPGVTGPRDYVPRLFGQIQILSSQTEGDQTWLWQQINQWYDQNIEKVEFFDRLVLFDNKLKDEPFRVTLRPVSDPEKIMSQVVPASDFLNYSDIKPVILKIKYYNTQDILVVYAQKGNQLFTVLDQETQLPLDASLYDSFSLLPLSNGFGLFYKKNLSN